MADSVGSYTYGAEHLRVLRWDGPFNAHCQVRIGKFCSLADGVEILTNGNHHYDRVSTFPFAELGWIPLNSETVSAYGNGAVTIENDVWIGRNVKIVGSLRIGNGAIIAANSVVVKDVDDYAVVGGNPARLIRYRFEEATRKKLLEIQWWNWEETKIKAILPYLLRRDNCASFLEKVL